MIPIILCPHCGKDVEISQALTHELEEQALGEVRTRHKQELEEVVKRTQEKAKIAVEERFSLELKNSKEEIEETKKRNKELITQLTEMTQLIRDLKRHDEERELQMNKTLGEKEEVIREESKKKAEEEQHLKILEKDKQLQDALKVNDELKRKLQQGSQQTQGEVLELELEQKLASLFPHDNILPVAKGIRGGDIVQEVWDKNGNYCGKILWEFKHTKVWSEGWIDKLKEDQRAIKAEVSVIISEAFPTDTKDSTFRNGVWIGSRSVFLTLGYSLRYNLIQLFHERRKAQGKNEKMEILYNYVSGIEFGQRVEAFIEAMKHMQDEIEKEKRYFMTKWAREEKHLRTIIDNTYAMQGDLQSIMGASLPQLGGEDSQAVTDGQPTLV